MQVIDERQELIKTMKGKSLRNIQLDKGNKNNNACKYFYICQSATCIVGCQFATGWPYTQRILLTLFGMGFFRAAHEWGYGAGGKKAPIPKICLT